MLGVEHPDHLQAADARHLDVEQHVRTQAVGGADGLGGIVALADDLDILMGFEQNAQVFTRQRPSSTIRMPDHTFSSSGRRRVIRVN